MSDDKPNGRVTTAEFHAYQIQVHKDMTEGFNGVTETLNEMKVERAAFHARVEEQIGTLVKEQDRLRERSNVWDTINSIGAVFSGIVGYIFGDK